MTSLKRTLNSNDLTLLVVGSVIGSGIFLVPSTVLKQAGSVPIAMLAWLGGGILSLFGALSYAELGAMRPTSGGLYAYTRDAFGRFPAFLFGWTLFFVIGSGTVATLAVASANYMGQFAELTPLTRQLIAVGLIALMAVINVRGTRQSAMVQNWATGIKVGAIVVMSLMLLLMSGGTPAVLIDAPPLVANPAILTAVATAMISVLWAYEGWQYVTFSAGEAIDPQRTLPKSIVLGTVILIAIYLLANVAYLVALGPEQMAASERVAGDATAAVLGPLAGKAIALAIILSMYSAAHATVITAPRVYYSMAQDGVFFKKLAEVHPRFGTPAFAIISSCAWAAILAWSGTFEQLLTYVIFVGWIFYALGAAAVIVLRRTEPDAPRPFRVPWYPFTPVIFILSAIVIVGNAVIAQPQEALVGLGVVFAGAPAYLFYNRKRSVSSPRSPGTDTTP